jgi:hypothetical protein
MSEWPTQGDAQRADESLHVSDVSESEGKEDFDVDTEEGYRNFDRQRREAWRNNKDRRHQPTENDLRSFVETRPEPKNTNRWEISRNKAEWDPIDTSELPVHLYDAGYNVYGSENGARHPFEYKVSNSLSSFVDGMTGGHAENGRELCNELGVAYPTYAWADQNFQPMSPSFSVTKHYLLATLVTGLGNSVEWAYGDAYAY